MRHPVPPDRDPELRRLISLDAAAQADALARMAGEPRIVAPSRRRRVRAEHIDLPITRYATWLPADLRLSVTLDGIDTGLWCGTDKECGFVAGHSIVLNEQGGEALYHAAKGIVWAFEHDRKYASRDLLAEWQQRGGVR